MSFYNKYELVRLIRDGEAKTFSALERESRRPVMLHMLSAGDANAPDSLERKIRGLGASPQVIEVGEFAGSVYVVTDELDHFTTFRDWVAAQPQSSEPAVVPPPPKVPPAAPPAPPASQSTRPDLHTRIIKNPSVIIPRPNPPDEFDLLFGSPPPAMRTPVPPTSRARVDQASEPEAGEFTRLFGGASGAAAPAPKPPEQAEPGEFTRHFQEGSAKTKPPTQPAGPLRSEPPTGARGDLDPGEFTRQFQEGLPKTKPPSQHKAAPPEPEPPSQVTDDFERMFRSTPGPKPSRENLQDSGEFTKFFGPGLQGREIDIDAEHARSAPEPDSRPFQAAGEFTRMFGSSKDSGARTQNPTTRVTNFGSTSDMFKDPEELAKQAALAKELGEKDKGDADAGEYTRIIQPVKPQEKAPAPKAEASAPAAAGNGRRTALFVGGGVLLAVLLGLVITLLLHSVK